MGGLRASQVMALAGWASQRLQTAHGLFLSICQGLIASQASESARVLVTTKDQCCHGKALEASTWLSDALAHVPRTTAAIAQRTWQLAVPSRWQNLQKKCILQSFRLFSKRPGLGTVHLNDNADLLFISRANRSFFGSISDTLDGSCMSLWNRSDFEGLRSGRAPLMMVQENQRCTRFWMDFGWNLF